MSGRMAYFLKGRHFLHSRKDILFPAVSCNAKGGG
jgi:hypothetical protein